MWLVWNQAVDVRPKLYLIVTVYRRQHQRKGGLMDQLLRMMEHYANKLEAIVEERNKELQEEKKKSEELLYQILPR